MRQAVKYIVSFIAGLMLFTFLQGQVSFRTMVTPGPVIAGESFQVQYIIEGLGEEDEFFAPDFKDFRFVSGPNIYAGAAFGEEGPRQLKNIVFTLVAIKPGKFIIPGASAKVGDKLVKSESLWIEVISKSDLARYKKGKLQEPNEDYFLAPGEDPYAKMQQNLFMKVSVDKRSCYVGEPVTATFKLYSRLESRSDIVKNPGFYGFTVQDMVNLDDRLSSTERVNGKTFDVHVVRKVQLYPLQPGLFHIDEMEVRNKVEFSRSKVSKKTEQEIAEGVYIHDEEDAKMNTAVFENNMNTAPVAITVKPVPEKNKPVEFTGATGRFKIQALLDNTALARNEEGQLSVVVSGQGNFTQLSAPRIEWPAGIEGFAPSVIDSLDHQHSPLSGKRIFQYRFVSAKPGDYTIPALSFSFFKPDSNRYETVTSAPLGISIGRTEKINHRIAAKMKTGHQDRSQLKWWLLLIPAVVAGAAYVVWYMRRRQASTKVVSAEPDLQVVLASALQPAYTFLEADDKMFYNILRKCVWDFFGQVLGVAGSNMNKKHLAHLLQIRGVPEGKIATVLTLLDQYETGLFTTVDESADKNKLLENARHVLGGILKDLQ